MNEDRHKQQLKSIGRKEDQFFICQHCKAHVYADKCTCDPVTIAEYRKRRAVKNFLSHKETRL